MLDAYASTLLINRLKKRFPGLNEQSLQELEEILFTRFSISAGLVDADIITDRFIFHALMHLKG